MLIEVIDSFAALRNNTERSESALSSLSNGNILQNYSTKSLSGY